MKQMLLAVAALASAVSHADVTTIYTTWTRGGHSSPKEYEWKDKDGNPVEMQNNGTEYAVIQDMIWSQGFNSGCDWNLNGICFDTAAVSYADGSGLIGLQRGGLKCTKACRFASSGNGGVTFKLIAGPQTWEGPASGDYASIGTGDDGHNDYPNYHKGKVAASSDVYDWTIKGRLALWMYYENVISHVKLRMESPARIYLPTAWGEGNYVLRGSPKLGVAQLTLAGEDVMWFAGVKTTAKLPMCNFAPVGVLNPALDSVTVAPKLILEDGADVQVENAIWDIPELVVSGAGAKSAFIGDLTVVRDETNVELKDGATLEFATVSREKDVAADVTVTGTGTIRVDPAGWGLTGTLALGANVCFETVGAAAFAGDVSGGTLVLNPGAGRFCRLDAATYAKMSDRKITVRSGTLCLGAMSALPTGATIEIAADAAVQFSSNDGYDAARVTGAGKGNVSFPANLVTDEVVTETEIVLNDGEVLNVAGDGLTAATTVKLNGGTLRFLTSAVVASPLSISRGSFVEAIDADSVGTVAGFVTSKSQDGGHSVAIPVQYGSSETATPSVNGLWTLGPGTVRYTGGGTFDGTRDPFVVTRDARVYLAGGTYDFTNGRGDSPGNAMVRLQSLVGGKDYGYGRLLCVCDGGALTFKGHPAVNECVYVTSPKNGSDYNLSPWISTFEVGAGGTVTIPALGNIHLGSGDSHVQLKISGGTLKMDSDTAHLFVGEGSGTYGSATVGADILLEGGTLSIGSPIIREKGGDLVTGDRSARGRLIWTGGTLKLNEHFNAPTIFDISQALKDCPDPRVSGTLRQIVRIDGPSCTLDLSEMGCASVANVPVGMDQSEWFGTGALAVKGGREFVMNSFPNAMGITTAGTGTKVTVPPAACVYDNALCLAHWNVKMEDFGKPYSTRAEALASATVATLTSAGTNGTFAVTRTDLPLSVENVRVTGEWSNFSSVSAVGALTLGDMTFADGSTLAAAVKGGGTVCQNITGTLTLPSSVRVRTDRTADIVPTGVIALSADGGITGSPIWIGTRGCKASNDASSVWIELSGMAIILR